MRSLSCAPAVAICIVLAVGLLPVARTRSQARATERIMLVIEVLEREERPTIPCGHLGPQPRDVTARVISVEEGTLEGDRILLSWPVCSLASIALGHSYRIQVRRFLDRPAHPQMRYRVRHSTPLDREASTIANELYR